MARAIRSQRPTERTGARVHGVGPVRAARTGAVVLAGLVAVGLHPAVAVAAAVPNAVKDVKVTSDAVGYWDKVRVDLTWAVPDGSAAGDTFQVVLPEQLTMDPGFSFPLNDSDGTKVADAAVGSDGRTVVFTLTDYVRAHQNVRGDAWFEATWSDVVEPGSTQTLVFGGSATPFRDTVTVGPIDVYTGGGKWQDWSAAPAPYGSLTWGVNHGKVEPGDVGKTVTFTDSPGPGQQVDCDSLAITTLRYLDDGRTERASWVNDPPGVVCDAAANTVRYSLTLTEEHVGLGVQLFGRSIVTDARSRFDNTGTVTVDGLTSTYLGSDRRSDAGGSGAGDLPSVSVGDKVWNDLDGDGIQDATEPGIPGVRLTLTGPDVRSVTDVHGTPVAPATTDAEGEYTFERLPVLPAGQHYVVTLDSEASQDALQGLVPTTPGVGPTDTDSSTGMAVSTELATGGAEDLTLDFGFRSSVPSGTLPGPGTEVRGVQVEPSGDTPTVTPGTGDSTVTTTTRRSGTPTPTTSNRGWLARTGAETGVLAGAGLSLIAAGSVLVARLRRRHTR